MQIWGQMKKRIRIVAGVILAIGLVVLVIVIVFPQVAATRYGFFDVNNGRKKLQWVSFGHVYRQSVEDTQYSKLLKKLGFNETPPDWRLATQEEMGLRRLFCAQYVDYFMGRIEADSKMFALTIELKKPDETKAREMAGRFRALVQKGDASEVRQYLSLLSQEK